MALPTHCVFRCESRKYTLPLSQSKQTHHVSGDLVTTTPWPCMLRHRDVWAKIDEMDKMTESRSDCRGGGGGVCMAGEGGYVASAVITLPID